MDELKDLARDRSLRTREIHAQNDFYGHATVFKHYAGISNGTTLKAVVEHGLFFGGFVWDEDIKSCLPSILTYSRTRFPYLKAKTEKRLFAVGPMIAYAPHLLSAESLRSEKLRLGRNLLVFPAHSTHYVDSVFDIDEYCQHIAGLAASFDSVRICLYWKDVLKGWGEKFAQHGFECVTAGHIFDPLFLPRLKSLIECAAFTTSNELGTHLGYCVFLGKGHHLFSHNVRRQAQHTDICKRDAPDRSGMPDVVETKKAFSSWADPPTQSQLEVADRYWGISEIKTGSELRNVFAEADALYTKGRNPLFRLLDPCRWLARS
ncbi:MAG TPA: hypothetical protein VEH04_12810 [Verrucomicrobiae bacterium]|nr:hypothetical protein [Verrucomicrobiae bacterium]